MPANQRTLMDELTVFDQTISQFHKPGPFHARF